MQGHTVSQADRMRSEPPATPVDLREKTICVRYDRMRRDRFIVYFDGQRMGEATPLDLHANARLRAPATEGTEGEAA